MKKLVLFFAVAFAMSFASCVGNKTEATETTTDSIEVAVDTVANDSVAADSAAVEVAVDSAVVAQ